MTGDSTSSAPSIPFLGALGRFLASFDAKVKAQQAAPYLERLDAFMALRAEITDLGLPPVVQVYYLGLLDKVGLRERSVVKEAYMKALIEEAREVRKMHPSMGGGWQ